MNLRSFRTAAILTSIASLILCTGMLVASTGSDKLTKRMTKELGLNKDQSAKVKALNEKSAETAKALLAKLSDDTKRLNSLVKDESSDAVISEATAEVIADHRRMMDAHMAHQDSLQAILTPTQYAKVLVEMGESMNGKGKNRGMSFGLGLGFGTGGMGMGVGMGMPLGDE